MIEKLVDFLTAHQQIMVVTGAGVSTASGIPDYRDESGKWKHKEPTNFQDYLSSSLARQRYWARSAVGWTRFNQAEPSAAHRALSVLETTGRISTLITQNVDRLHQRAGSKRVIDLHGRLDHVICIDCHQRSRRADIQSYLMNHNPQLQNLCVHPGPDGDSQLELIDFSGIRVPECDQCGGILKPDVVFYGENVPIDRVKQCFDDLDRSDALLVVGSSLMVYSGFRFARRAAELNMPIAAVNRGITRADHLLRFKIEADCGEVLTEMSKIVTT